MSSNQSKYSLSTNLPITSFIFAGWDGWANHEHWNYPHLLCFRMVENQVAAFATIKMAWQAVPTCMSAIFVSWWRHSEVGSPEAFTRRNSEVVLSVLLSSTVWAADPHCFQAWRSAWPSQGTQLELVEEFKDRLSISERCFTHSVLAQSFRPPMSVILQCPCCCIGCADAPFKQGKHTELWQASSKYITIAKKKHSQKHAKTISISINKTRAIVHYHWLAAQVDLDSEAIAKNDVR